MKTMISTIFYLYLLMLPLSGQAEPAVVDNGIEVTSIHITIDGSLNGYAVVKRCPTCTDIRLKIDRETQVTSQGKTIPLRKLNHLQADYALVIYDLNTKHLNQIIW